MRRKTSSGADAEAFSGVPKEAARMEIITPEPTPPRPLTEEETKELRYIRSRYMDKYEGGPPWRGDEAYLANIQYL